MTEGVEFGRYRLIKPVGAGGMAQVHLARQIGPSGFVKPCVLKRIAPHMAADPEVRRMFLEEARISALLNHQGIVQTFDFGEVDGVPYMALELVDGANLGLLLRELSKVGASFPLRAAVELGIQLLEALDYAHQLVDLSGARLSLIHRDISPQNVLLSRQGGVKLADFGIARHNARAEMTLGYAPKGKPGYMAPEQGLGLALDQRVDLYALGVVLTEVIALDRFFSSTTPFSGSVEVSSRVRELLARRPSVPAALREVLEKLTAAAPDARPKNASAATALFRAVLSDLVDEPLSSFLPRALRDITPRADEPGPKTTLDPPEAPAALGWPTSFEDDREPDIAPPEAVQAKAPVLKLAAPSPQARRIDSTASALAGDPSAKRLLETLGDGAKNDPKKPRSFQPVTLAREPRSAPWGLGVLLLAAAGLFVHFRGPPIFPWQQRKVVEPVSGSILVRSTPPGAEILINDLRQELVTPHEIRDLPLRLPLRVSVRRPGFVGSPREVTIELQSAGPQTLSFELVPAIRFHLVTAPQGAWVRFAGRDLPEPTPLDLPELPLGERAEVEIRRAGYLGRNLVLSAVAGTATVVSVDLVRASSVELTTQPAGAKVFVDGLYEGLSPIYELALPSQKRVALRIALAGYAPIKRSVSASEVRAGKLSVTLTPIPLGELELDPKERAELARLVSAEGNQRRALASAKKRATWLERDLLRLQGGRGSSMAAELRAQAALESARTEIEQFSLELDETAEAFAGLRTAVSLRLQKKGP